MNSSSKAMTPTDASERERLIAALHTAGIVSIDDQYRAADMLRADAEKIRALEADAARYRWLRAQPNVDIGSCWFLPNEVPVPSTADELDAAIDAALSAVRPSQGDGGGKGEGEKVG